MKTRKAAKAAKELTETAPKLAMAPRLVKAAEHMAREVVRSMPRVAAPAPRPVRVPRGATEARAVFNTLFGGTAKA